MHDREDREKDKGKDKEPAWHDLNKLAEGLNAFPDKINVAYIAEVILRDESQFIERDLKNQNVRLTELGRKNCDKGIDIPPSNNQARVNL